MSAAIARFDGLAFSLRLLWAGRRFDLRVAGVDGMVLVYVPVGPFTVRSGVDDGEAKPNERPQHAVYQVALLIDRTEVSNR